MNLGIALLLRGSSADLSATLYAIELAKRTSGIVHAVFMQQREVDPGEETEKDTRSGTDQLIQLVRLLGDAEDITIHIHMLEGLSDEVLVRFVCEHRIFCLILGARSQGAANRKNAWVARLRRRLSRTDDCFLPPLWSVVIKPWDDPFFEDRISGFSRSAWSATAIRLLAGSLRNDLKGLNNISV